EHDPFRADVAQRLVRLLASTGDQGGAVQFAESHARRLREELGIEDDGGLLELARSTPTPRATPAVSGAGSVNVAAGSATEDPRRRSGARYVPAAIAVAAVALIAAVFLFWPRASGKPGESVAGAETLAIVPFRAAAGDSQAADRDAIADLLAARFTGEIGPRAIEPRASAAAWADLSRSASAPALDAALKVARTLGASRMLMGEFVRSSDSTELSVSLYNTAGGPVLATAAVDAARGESLARLCDRVVALLLARAEGARPDQIDEMGDRPLAAVRPYLAANRAYASSRYAAAESLYARALDADSTFAAAGLGLAMANSWTVISEAYGRGRDAALHYAQSLSPRDRAFSAAFFGPDPALGPPRPAPVYLAAWEDVVEKWPDWPEAWYQLGDRYYHYGALSGLPDPLDRARTAFRRALAQDSTLSAPLHHLVELYSARGELDALRPTAERFFAANPSVDRDRSAIGWEVAMALNDSAWLSRLRANFPAMPREDLTRVGWVTDANGWPAGDAVRAADLLDRQAVVASEHEKSLVLLYALSLNAGHPSEARVAAAGLGAVFPDRPVGAVWDLMAALFGVDAVDTALANSSAARLASFVAGSPTGDHVERDQHHLALCLDGYWSALRGDERRAANELARVRADARAESNNFARRNADVCAAMVSATLAVRAREPGASREVAALDTLLLRERVPPHSILEAGTLVSARLHAALGDTAGALIAARRREHLTGDPLFLSSELLAEARMAAALHDRDNAERSYREFLALQPTPEPGAPADAVARVRAELARLQRP
ncbi:MAG TPA: hypothetical protein VFT41_11830, partial [Gemmatimonadaceae bacterium]|nr:hypothetical protein [Gemmatimonadaceae bacterium]